MMVKCPECFDEFETKAKTGTTCGSCKKSFKVAPHEVKEDKLPKPTINYQKTTTDYQLKSVKKELLSVRNELFILKTHNINVKKSDIKIILMALKTYHQAYKNKAIKGAGSQIIIDRVKQLMEELK